MNHRFLGTSGLAITLALGLSACGGGGGSSLRPQPAPRPTPSPTVTPTPTPAPAPTTVQSQYDTPEYQASTYAVAGNAISAYDKGFSGKGVKIGVIDSGINGLLPEFAGRIDPASGDVAGNRGISDEGGHGTAVSAVAAAGRNGFGTMGVAFDATIVNLRADDPGSCASDDGCSFYDEAIARGIDAARVAGVKVINLSLGGSTPGTTLLAAMQRAVSAGVVLVISAGNDGREPEGVNPDSFALVPAQQFSGSVIIAGSVGVSTENGVDSNQLSTFSNKAGTGSQWYLTALGHRDLAPDHSGAEYFWSGTSFSAPTITGAVALLAQAFPNLTGQQIVDILFKTADDLGKVGTDAVFGRGRLDIAQAFTPLGATSMAGSGTPVSTTDNGSLPAASGDGAGVTGTMGAIILDGYSRAFVLDFAQTLRLAPQAQPLAPAVQASLRGFTAAAGPMTIAMTLRDRTDLPQGFALERLGIGPEDARKSRIIAGQAIAQVDGKTALAFGFGESAKSIERRLMKAQNGAFMIAKDIGSDPGFQANRGTSIAVRRNLGPVNATISGETGKLRRQVQDSVTEPAYRLTGVTLDRSFGSTWVAAGVSRLDEANSLLGGAFAPALGGGGSRTFFADAEAQREFGMGFAASVSTRRGWTSFATGDLQTSAYAFDLSKRGLLGDGDRIGLRVSQPLRVESGGFGLMLPTGYDYSTLSATSSFRSYALTPSGREVDAELSYGSSLLRGKGWLGANLFARRQPGHIEGADTDYGAAIRFTLGM
ncbi:MAG: S8 family serine peptidase [Pseudomonadota bacterium]|nr:S8 family serine peptidase [Pseudomonadota bacterium]